MGVHRGVCFWGALSETLFPYRRKRVWGEPTGSLESLGLGFCSFHIRPGRTFSYSRSIMGKVGGEKIHHVKITHPRFLLLLFRVPVVIIRSLIHLELILVHGIQKEEASQVALLVKNLLASAGNIRDVGSIHVSGRSPGGRQGNPLQCSCLENPVDRGAWWATVRRVSRLSNLACTHAYRRKPI